MLFLRMYPDLREGVFARAGQTHSSDPPGSAVQPQAAEGRSSRYSPAGVPVAPHTGKNNAEDLQNEMSFSGMRGRDAENFSND